MLISKLSNTYSLGDTSLILGKKDNVDPILLGRLARVAEVNHCTITIKEGYRSYATQSLYYNEYIKYLKTGKVGPLGIKLASKPGLSWHEHFLAVDVADSKIKALGNDYLKKFGLIKPLISKGETWHIQPIEVQTGSANASLIDKYKPMEGTMQKIKIAADGKTVEVEAINVNGTNYVKLRDMDKINTALHQPTEVSYNKLLKMPEVKAI